MTQASGDTQTGQAKHPSAPRVRGPRFGLVPKLGLVLFATLIAALWVVLPMRALPLPIWAVAQIEARLNDTLHRSLPNAALSIEAVEVRFGRDFTPQLGLTGLQFVQADGGASLTLPEVQLTLAPAPLLRGTLRPQSLRVIGADLAVTRDAAGALDLALADPAVADHIAPKPQISKSLSQSIDLKQIFALSDAFLASPLAAGLHSISAEALSLRLTDLRLGREWRLGDGLLEIKNRDGELGGEMQLSLVSSRTNAAAPMPVTGRVIVSLIVPKRGDEARISMRLGNVDAGDFASQFAPLAWVGLLDAPLSGRIASTLTPQGISAMEADLTFAAGALQPSPAAKPIAFDTAQMRLVYDPETGRIHLPKLQIQSPGLRLIAAGHGDFLRQDGSQIAGVMAGERPDSIVAQLQVSQLQITQPDLFARPVVFGQGALDLRLRLDPFTLDIGQMSLVDGGTHVVAQGRAQVGPMGWNGALDLGVNQLGAAQLLGVWPRTLFPGTRGWLDRNLLAGNLRDLHAAMRVRQDQKPVVELGFKFADLNLRVMPSLPAITGAAGYGTIAGAVFTLAVERGEIIPPAGGAIDLAGSTYAIHDVKKLPAIADITLKTNASLTATLSLLDQKPFQFLSKAGRGVDLGQGRAELVTQLHFPLKKLITLPDVTYQTAGNIRKFTSDILVPGRAIVAENLSVQMDSKGLEIAGPGTIAAVPFDAVYAQKFGPKYAGKSQINGTVALSDAALQAFGIALPTGAVTGAGTAQVTVDLTRGAAAKLTLTSDLNRIGLEIPQMGWVKPKSSLGKLAANITLSAPPVVDQIDLKAADLQAKGRITLRAKGGLERAEFSEISVGKWLAGAGVISGQGAGKPVALALSGGDLDLRFLPPAAARKGGAGPAVPLSLKLDRMRVSDGISLTGVEGDFQMGAGVSGNFVASVDGGPRIMGRAAPTEFGTGMRITARDAGAVLSAANIYTSARGGLLDMTLIPRQGGLNYDGQLAISALRVQNASALADLLNAVSVVGLLDQLGGEGILFNNVTGRFLLTPDAVELRDGAATGASLGVTMGGVYDAKTRDMDMQGTISPVYLLNGLGEVFARRGEGVVGFNYTLRGPADAPRVAVDPLSVLTPGFLRDVFRKAAPAINDTPAATPEPATKGTE